jgi:hypothetical protein
MAELTGFKPSTGNASDEAGTPPETRPPPGADALCEGPPEAGAGGTPAPGGAARAAIEDVWSRTEPKYRNRAVLLLLVTLVLFCGLCVFTHWLHVDRPFDFSWRSYAAPLKFWGEQTLNLNDFVLYPISVEQNPMHGVVLGLLLASIVAVPISVAILYRFPFALPFVAAVLIFAHMPWMAFTLAGSCILASVKPFRLSFRFGAALVGMLPVILYLYLATRGTATQIGGYASPDQKLLLAAPWVLALIAACVLLGAILGISRVVKYRPGAVAPVIAVMFATPAILFHAYVGVDEVSYRVLEAEYGPRAERFAVRDLADKIPELLRAKLAELTPQELLDVTGSPERLIAFQERLRQQFAQRLLREFLAERRAAYEACKEFIADYPDSRYVPNVLYMQARVLDLRLKSIPPTGPLRRELYTDYPHVQADEAWLALLTWYPESPLAIAARLRLAQLRVRRGDVAEALALLVELRARVRPPPETAPSATQPGTRAWLRKPPAESSLAFDSEPYEREVQRLDELIRANRDDPKYGVTPLAALAGLDPNRPGYSAELLRLAQRFPDALLHDNLVVLWAANTPDRDVREARLQACIRDFPAGDALAQALLRLAELELQARGDDQESRRQTGLARLTAVAERFRETRAGQEAAEQLRLLRPTTAPATSAAVPP